MAALKALAEPFFGVKLAPAPEPGGRSAPSPQPACCSAMPRCRARLPWLRYEARFSPSTLAAEERALAKGRPLPAPGNPRRRPIPPPPAMPKTSAPPGGSSAARPWSGRSACCAAQLLSSPKPWSPWCAPFSRAAAAAANRPPRCRAAAAAQAGIPEDVVQSIFDRQTVDLGAAEQGGLAAFIRGAGRPRAT